MQARAINAANTLFHTHVDCVVGEAVADVAPASALLAAAATTVARMGTDVARQACTAA